MGNDSNEKLQGPNNHNDWEFAAQSLLVINDHWPCNRSTDQDLDKHLLAISTFGLLIEPFIRMCELFFILMAVGYFCNDNYSIIRELMNIWERKNVLFLPILLVCV